MTGLFRRAVTVAEFATTHNLNPVTVELADRLVLVELHRGDTGVMRRWLQHLDAVDMTAHRRGGAGPVRLNIRGLLLGIPVVVHTTYADPAAIEIILGGIETATPRTLLEQLTNESRPA